MTVADSSEIQTPDVAHRHRLRLCRMEWLVVILGIVWVFAGVGKALDYEYFSAVVALHGVLPDAARSILFLVPVLEIGLGVTLFLSVGSSQRTSLLRAALLAGSAFLVSLAVYLMLVPAAVLEDVGCGCFGQSYSRLASGIPVPARLISMCIASVLLIAHAFAFNRLKEPLPATAKSPVA